MQRKLWRGGPASWLVDQLSLHLRSVGCSAICAHSRTLSFDIEMTMHVVLTKILVGCGSILFRCSRERMSVLITALGALHIPCASVQG